MNLQETLQLIALQLRLDPDDLTRFANEDTIGGYSANAAESKWMIGSLYEVEGKTLYALVRALKPDHVAEIGSLRGCSTTHLATALAVNEHGRITAVDVNAGARDQFPNGLEQLLTAVVGDGLEWLAGQEDGSIDFLFEDSSHGEEMCRAVAELAKTKLSPGGVMVMHDAAHDFAILGDGRKLPSEVGETVRRGLDKALGPDGYRVYLAAPSDCGLAIYQRKAEKFTPIIKDMGYSEPQSIADLASDFSDTPSPAETPKKKRTPKKATQ